MVLGFLLWDSVPDRANQELCAEHEKKKHVRGHSLGKPTRESNFQRLKIGKRLNNVPKLFVEIVCK